MQRISISGLLTLVASLALGFGSAQEFRPLSKGTPTSVVNYVQEMFLITQESGSMTLSGTCAATLSADDVVPDALPHPPQGPFRSLDDAMSAVSQSDPHLSWTRDKSGLLRGRDDRAWDDILLLRLKRVHFNGDVNVSAAIQDVMSSPEVRAYFKKNHIETGIASTFLGMGSDSHETKSTIDSPRLWGDLDDVTVAEALDRIVRFFPGLWIYSECRSGPIRRVIVRGVTVRLLR